MFLMSLGASYFSICAFLKINSLDSLEGFFTLGVSLSFFWVSLEFL
jgi:hypothetical protein